MLSALLTRNERSISIDILRAFSFFAVFIFHLYPNKFENGWIGVDLFFSISGYLIAASINSGCRVWSIQKYVRYIAKRFNRIYSPFLLFIPLSLAIIFILLDYSEGANNSKYLLIGSIFLALPYYQFSDSSYFEQDTTNYFVHLWSLSGELFLYIIFPLLLILSRLTSASLKIREGYVLILFYAIFASLLWSDSYYTLTGRAIFFLCGAAPVIFSLNCNILRSISYYFPFFGYLVFALSVFLVVSIVLPLPAINPYPNWIYVLTTSVLVFFLFSVHHRKMQPFDTYIRTKHPGLGNSKVLAVLLLPGVYSLSFYLYHYPVIHMMRLFSLDIYHPYLFIILSILVTSLLAILSAWIFEAPTSHRHLVLRLAPAAFIPVTASMLVFHKFYFVAKWNSVMGLDNISYSSSCNRDFYNNLPQKHGFPVCLVTQPSIESEYSDLRSSKTIFIVGDSHADTIYNALSDDPPASFTIVRIPLDHCSPHSLRPSGKYFKQQCLRSFNRVLALIASKATWGDNVIFSFFIDHTKVNVDDVKFLTDKLSGSSFSFLHNVKALFVLSKSPSSSIVSDSVCRSRFAKILLHQCSNGYIIDPRDNSIRTSLLSLLSKTSIQLVDLSNLWCHSGFTDGKIWCNHLDGRQLPILADKHHHSSFSYPSIKLRLFTKLLE
jgi:peptidoglycan/LPS O-acetylase OafA/YrhL